MIDSSTILLEKKLLASEDLVRQRDKEISLLQAQITLLRQEIQELKSRLKIDSTTSSRPPSSDGYGKKPAFPKPQGGKVGGQAKHKGVTLEQVDKPDEKISCMPSQCHCGHSFQEADVIQTEKRQVFDIPPPKINVKEYQVNKVQCPHCGKIEKGKAPVKAPVQYGANAKSLVVLLNSYYNLPYKKIQTLFSDLYGIPLNVSTVNSSIGYCYDHLEESEKKIQEAIIAGKTAHSDESGIRVNGSLNWLHVTSTDMYTYLFAHAKRGAEAMNSVKSILGDLWGWLVHDCWANYFKYNNCRHALCNAHILRELTCLEEHHNSKWARVFKNYLLSVYKMPYQSRLSHRKPIEDRFDKICKIAESIEPQAKQKAAGQKGRSKKTKGRNLLERLQREKEAILAFAFHREVPFTNNLGERDIRPAKTKLKVSGGFRSFVGAEYYARIQSFISTARKHDKNVFEQICNTFMGYNFLCPNDTS